ncbi:hypothetical protein OG788_02160 [Streptomyces sp. NBC_00647]|uniref:hypothetical protein n=1 Tax=Streptomyces sp. NBC_00647 TaxID=2975796 RepID=UPI00324F6397
MNGTPGILPVWDIDDAHGSEPRWYAMPRAQLVEKAVGEPSGKGELRKPCGGLQPQGLHERQAPPAQALLRMQGKAIACAAHAPIPRVIPPAVPAGAAVAQAGGDAPAAAVCAAGHDAGECPLPVRTHLVDYLSGPLPQTRVCSTSWAAAAPNCIPRPWSRISRVTTP